MQLSKKQRVSLRKQAEYHAWYERVRIVELLDLFV